MTDFGAAIFVGSGGGGVVPPAAGRAALACCSSLHPETHPLRPHLFIRAGGERGGFFYFTPEDYRCPPMIWT